MIDFDTACTIMDYIWGIMAGAALAHALVRGVEW
jgi:hypothetical protein